jgi:quercetin dioxygenase-like cupin family protein
LSVVGTDRLTGSGAGSLSGYFRAKVAQEDLIKASGIPFTIVHATQFFEFVKGIAQSGSGGSTIRLSSVLMQPMAADDVAAAVAQAALGQPENRMIEVAGPDQIRQDELVRQYLSATGDLRKVVTDDKPLYFGIEVKDQSLVPGHNPRLGSMHFAEWLSRTATQKAATEKRSAPVSDLSGKAAKVIALLLGGVVFAALSLRDSTAADSPDKSNVAATAEPKQAKLTQLFSKDLTDLPGKEGLMLMIEYPPGSSDPIHRHNAHGFIYVLEGSIVMQVRGGKEVTLTPGQTFYEGPEDVHVVGRNASETEAAKFVVFFVKDKGAPVLVPAK